MKSSLAFAISCLFLYACSGGKLSTEEMTSILKERNDKLAQYFITGNSDSLAALYTADARLCLSGFDFVSGRQAIGEFWKNDMKSTVTHKMRTETMTVRGVNDVIYETGRTHLNLTFQDSTFDLTLKYCNVWRRQPDGKYLLDVDIANRDKSN